MKLFFDTNVLLDVVAERKPFLYDSREVLSLGAQEDFSAMSVGMTFCTIAYVMRGTLQGENLRRVLRVLRKYVRIVPIDDKVVAQAIEGFSADFEDEVQRLCAENNGADVIITRDKHGFVNASIPVMTPTEFLYWLEQ